MQPTSGSRAMAQIHSIFRPVLITWTINAAWMAIDRIGMRYKGESPDARGPRGSAVAGHCKEKRSRSPRPLAYVSGTRILRSTARQSDHPMFDKEYPNTRWERASTVTSISQPWKPTGAPAGVCGKNQTYTHFVDAWSILRGSPNASCSRLTGFPTLSAAIRGTGRTAYPDWPHPAAARVPKVIARVIATTAARDIPDPPPFPRIAVLPAKQRLAQTQVAEYESTGYARRLCKRKPCVMPPGKSSA